MGFFKTILDAAKEASDDAHGVRLLQEVQSSLACMKNLDSKVQSTAMIEYLQILGRVVNQMPNWSREERIKLGRRMQQQARHIFDTNVGEGYATWLAGAWLESQDRNSRKAQQAFGLLEGFADYIRREVA